MSVHPISHRTSFLFMVHNQPTSLTNQADPSPREHLLYHAVSGYVQYTCEKASERLNSKDMHFEGHLNSSELHLEQVPSKIRMP